MERARGHDEPLCERVGEDGFRRLVGAFYASVRTDAILAPMYPEHDLDGAERRLADFLVMRFGGSDRYVRERGHPRLRMRHALFAIDPAARDRWLALMGAALAASSFPDDVRAVLTDFFFDVAHMLQNRA